jgi:hypothetical protein
MSDARIVLAFLLYGQPSNLDDKKAALALAKEYPAEFAAIGVALGKSRGSDVKWA